MSFMKNFLTALSEDSMINPAPDKNEQPVSNPTADNAVVFTSIANIFDTAAAKPEPDVIELINSQPAAETEPIAQEPPVIELIRAEPIEAAPITAEPPAAAEQTANEPVNAEPATVAKAMPAVTIESAPNIEPPTFESDFISELFSLSAKAEPVSISAAPDINEADFLDPVTTDTVTLPTEPIATVAEPVVAEPVVTVAEPVVAEPVVTVAEPIVAEPVVTAAEPLAAVEDDSFSIKSFFASKGIEMTLPATRKEAIPAIESLAFSIAVNYSHTKNFIRYLRECICKKNYNFSYSIAYSSAADKPAIIALANLLNEYCIISGLNKGSNIIRGTISTCPKCINFLCGDFAEMYAKSVTVGVLKKLSAEYGEDFEIYNNVDIEKYGEKHELDIVFRVGPHVFWEEIKSGDFDANKYRKIGTLLDLIPDRLILLAAEKSNDAVQGITYFYDYFCANTNTFKGSLTEMIRKAFEEEKNND